MQPESSMDPGEISIQKLKEACEMVMITKQRRHIFLKMGFLKKRFQKMGLQKWYAFCKH